jgi:hypothetical protein
MIESDKKNQPKAIETYGKNRAEDVICDPRYGGMQFS